jgi:integrase
MTDDPLRHLPAIVDADATTGIGAPRALPDAPPLDFVIALWLSEQRSPRTRSEYAATLADYRAHLAQVTLDLDAGSHHQLAQVAQAWSLRPTRQRGARYGAAPSSAITARRLAIVSSFYQCAIRHGLHEGKRDRTTNEPYRDEIESNPLRYLKRPSVQRYAEAQPIEQRELIARLRRIDRATVLGKRDYALLSVALTTGRRIAELQGMTRGSLTFGRDHRVTVRFPTKGAKVMRDRLGDKTSAALLDYLRVAYAVDDPATLPHATPIWRDFSRPAQWRREQRAQSGETLAGLSTSGIRRIFARWLGTSKAHVSRHSFGPLMEQAGASLTDIQARLGHASAKTTADYLNALKSADNPFVDRLEALLGLE